MGRRWGLAGIGAGLAAGLALALALRGTPDPETSRDASANGAAALIAEVEELRDALEELRESGEAQAAELAWLRQQLERRTGAPQSADFPPPGAARETAPSLVEGRPARATGPAGAATARPGETWFDQDRILALGVEPADAERLRASFEHAKLQELFLTDRAAREGWGMSRRYRQAVNQLQRGLREELSDEDYDLVLYATGQHNRVALGGLLADSPAVEAGLQPGDVILRYDGQRIFDGRELRTLTHQGKAGSTVTLQVLRDGEVVYQYLPRGPIGARLAPRRMAPDQS